MSANVTHIAGRLGWLLDRLGRVRKAGKGYTAQCPAHPDKTASLSIAEGNNGAILVHCFAGCDPASVVQAVGLTIGDLFPERLSPQSPGERAEMLRYARESKWAAALEVIGFESLIVWAAAGKMARGEALSAEDHERLSLAVNTLHDARESMRVR